MAHQKWRLRSYGQNSTHTIYASTIHTRSAAQGPFLINALFDQFSQSLSDALFRHFIVMPQPAHQPLLVKSISDRPLVLRQCHNKCREAEAQPFPAGRPGCADSEVRLGHKRCQGRQIAVQVDVGIPRYPIPDIRSIRAAAGYHDIGINIGAIQAHERRESKPGQVVTIRPAERDEDAADRTFPRRDAVVQFSINRLQESVFRSQQQVTILRYLADIVGLHIRNKILVQQQVTIVSPVGKVIDHQDSANQRAEGMFPARIKGVVVHYQPVRFGAQNFDNSTGLVGIFLPCRSEPGSVGRGCFGFRFFVRRRKAVNDKTPLFDQVTEVAVVLAADKRDFSAPFDQNPGQAQATHDMTCADSPRGIGAEDNLQSHDFLIYLSSGA